jgi:hypothetical protein
MKQKMKEGQKSDFKNLLNEVCTLIGNKKGNNNDKFSSLRRDFILNPKYKNQNSKLKFNLLFNRFNNEKKEKVSNNILNKMGNIFIDTMKPPKEDDINDTKDAIKSFLSCVKNNYTSNNNSIQNYNRSYSVMNYRIKDSLYKSKYLFSSNNGSNNSLNNNNSNNGNNISKMKNKIFYLLKNNQKENKNILYKKNVNTVLNSSDKKNKNINHIRNNSPNVEIFRKELSYFLNKNFFPSSNTNNEQKSIDTSTNDSTKNFSSFFKMKTFSKSLSHLELRSIESKKKLQKSQEDLKKIEKDIQDSYIRYFIKYGKIKKPSSSINFK